MAESSWMGSWSGWLFNTKAAEPSKPSLTANTSEQTFEHYLQRSTQCMERVQMMTLPEDSKSIQVKFNYEQCKYLTDKLRSAVDCARTWFYIYRFHSRSLDDETKLLELYKILFMLAKEVEGFIQGCSKVNWIQAAIMLTNMSDHVCSLGFDLELCSIFLFSLYKSQRMTTEEVSDLKNVDLKLVKEKAFIDDGTLLTKVKALIEASEASSDDCELATFLRVRLDRSRQQSPPTGARDPLHLDFYERSDISSLKYVQRIGNGAFAVVHKAIWRGAEVAVKIFHGLENPVFKKEVLICAKVSHPNIASLLFYGVDNGDCSIVMELMDEDLQALMKTRLRHNRTSETPFCLFIAFDLMLQIAEGMCYLHKMRIVHRDLKSQNILVQCVKSTDGDGHVYVKAKVADFGLSGTKMRSTTYSNQTLHMGTTRWMAPEMIKRGRDAHQKKYPFKSDVYSFGIVCYEILTGKLPFSAIHNNGEIKRKILAGDRPELPHQCPNELRTLIEKCWSAKASTRPRFADVCSELRYLKSSLMLSCVDEHAAVQPLQVETVKDDLECETTMRMHEDTSSAMSVPPQVNTKAAGLLSQTEGQVLNKEEELLAKATAVVLQKMMVFSTPPAVNTEAELQAKAPINNEEGPPKDDAEAFYHEVKLTTFKGDLEELLVVHSLEIPRREFMKAYQKRFGVVLDLSHFGVDSLDALLHKVTDVAILKEQTINGRTETFVVAV